MTCRPPLLAFVLLAPRAAGADPGQVRVQTLKAAFICHFLVLTRWPEQKTPLVLGIYGNSPMGEELAAVMPKSVGALAIKVVRLAPEGANWGALDALYIPMAYQGELPAILKRLGPAPVLTIGDTANFIEDGGVIGFLQEDNRLHFEINLGAASRRGLQLSAKLLELARAVKR